MLAPYLTGEFALNATSLGALTASYLLAFAVMQVPLGLLIDRYGVRRVQSINMLVAGAGASYLRLRASSRHWQWRAE